MSKTLWMMVGIAGSGKTYFAKHNLMNGPGWWYVSRDEIRFSLVKEDEDYFSKETEVFNTFINKIKQGINAEGIYNIVADATHFTKGSRAKLIKALKTDDLQIIPVVIKADLINVLKQNAQRVGRACVNESVIKRMAGQFEDPASDNFKYTAIMYVDNNQVKLVEKPKYMYYKNDIQMKEIPLKDIIKKG